MLPLLVAVAIVAAQPAPSATPLPPSSPTPSPSSPAQSETTIHFILPTPVPTKPPCETAKIVPAKDISSKDANPGEGFEFTVSSVDDPRKLFPTVVPGSNGMGVIAVVRRGRTGGEPGLLVLEARYIVGNDGAHVPALFARTINGLFLGRTNNSPGVLGFVPYVGYVASAYDALHKGGDTGAGPQTTLVVALGDEPVTGACVLPTAAP